MNKHGDKRVLFQVALKNVRPLNFHITAPFPSLFFTTLLTHSSTDAMKRKSGFPSMEVMEAIPSL